MNDSSRISVTAHYTGYVWKKNSLALTDIGTTRGWCLYQFGRPFNFLMEHMMDGTSLESFLLDRHLAIDTILKNEVESGRITQVLELAAGLSPRGEKFMAQYAENHGLVFIESDLPEQIKFKKAMLSKKKAPHSSHHFVGIDALAPQESVHSLKRATQGILNPNKNCLVISEGILSYFQTEQVLALWSELGRFLKGFPSGKYISDLHLQREQPSTLISNLVRKLIESSVRGRLHVHFDEAREVEAVLKNVGFSHMELLLPSKILGHKASSVELLRILVADQLNDT